MRKRPSLNPKSYPKPRKWLRGFVSVRQERKFKRSGRLQEFYWGMLANTPGASKASKLNRLPYRVKRK